MQADSREGDNSTRHLVGVGGRACRASLRAGRVGSAKGRVPLALRTTPASALSKGRRVKELRDRGRRRNYTPATGLPAESDRRSVRHSPAAPRRTVVVRFARAADLEQIRQATEGDRHVRGGERHD